MSSGPHDKVRFAVIGCGHIGKRHAEMIQRDGEAELVALCDVDWSSAADAFRSYPKARRYRDYREMLDKEARNIDAVTVSTPDHSHAAATLLALVNYSILGVN